MTRAGSVWLGSAVCHIWLGLARGRSEPLKTGSAREPANLTPGRGSVGDRHPRSDGEERKRKITLKMQENVPNTKFVIFRAFGARFLSQKFFNLAPPPERIF